MPKRVEPREKIVQRGIGFNFRQHEFFNEHQTFKPDGHCRRAIDEQIRLMDKQFLSKEELKQIAEYEATLSEEEVENERV